MTQDFRPRLIQRLEKPYTTSLNINEGMLGFKESFLKTIKQIMSFDYMGSSEFEFGAVPRAFDAYIAEIKKGNIQTKTINLELLPPRFAPFETRDKLPPSKSAEIYIIAPTSLMNKVVQFLEELALEEPRLKEVSNFADSIYAEDIIKLSAYASGERTVGWFDIQYGYFFFRDKEMFENMKIASGLETNAKPSVVPATPQPM